MQGQKVQDSESDCSSCSFGLYTNFLQKQILMQNPLFAILDDLFKISATIKMDIMRYL